MMSEELTWENIYSLWGMFCRDLYPQILSENSFRKIIINPNGHNSENWSSYIIDWWPNESLDERIENINKYGFSNINWQTNKGILNTAQMLWDVNEDTEKQALVWIAASIKNITCNYFPEEWRGDTYRFMDKVQQIIMNEYRERQIWEWHGSTKYFLPNYVSKYDGLYCKPDKLWNLIHIIAIDSIVSRTTWTLVQVIQDEDNIT